MNAITTTATGLTVLLVVGGFRVPCELAAQETVAVDDFFFSEGHNPFTGDDQDVLFTISVEESSVQGVLGWTCNADLGLNINLVFGKYMSAGPTNAVNVNARFDREPEMEVAGCPMSGDHQRAMLHLDRVEEFTDAAKRGNRLLIEVQSPTDDQTLTYTFSLKGFTRGLNLLPCVRQET